MIKQRIIIADYSPSWALTFQQLKLIYQFHLDNLITDIQHVGSTAVNGLAAKPIIDIDIIINDKENLKFVIKKLEALGYEHRGNLGITDREAFKQKSNKVPFAPPHKWQKHNLYVCPSDSISLKNHLALRDSLRNNSEKAKEYAELKKRLALENPYEMDLYIERKTPFITSILKNVGFNDMAINSIIEENKVSKS